jgi:hypothetical protein
VSLRAPTRQWNVGDATALEVTAPAQALNVVDVDMRARRDVRRGPTDGLTVLEDMTARRHGATGQLMPRWNRLAHQHSNAARLDRFTGGQVNDGEHDAIFRVHQQGLHWYSQYR